MVVFKFARLTICWAHACCAPHHGPGGNEDCWDAVFSFEVCCQPEAEVQWEARARFAQQVAHHLWKRSLWYGTDEPITTCYRGGGAPPAPGLGLSPNGSAATTVAPGGLVAVVMTRLAEFEPGGRVQGLARTWARRLPRGSVALAMEDVDVPRGKVPEGVQVMRIACPDYWLLDCNTYTASIYLGHYGLRRMLRKHPRSRWFLIADDDLYLNPYVLARILRGMDAGVAVCVGAHESLSRPFLSYWSGIVCSNAAVRLLDQHLEGATREAVQTRLGYSAGDFIISKCLWDLGVPMVDVNGFFGGNWPLEGAAQPSRVAATFHRIATRQIFETVDLLLHGRPP